MKIINLPSFPNLVNLVMTVSNFDPNFSLCVHIRKLPVLWGVIMLSCNSALPIGMWTCNSTLPIGIRRFIGCNHIRAYEFFTESVNSDCPFYGFVCDAYDNFSVGKCPWGCGPDRSLCAPMGLKADKWRRFAGDEPVKMFLHTSNTEPFCSKLDSLSLLRQYFTSTPRVYLTS